MIEYGDGANDADNDVADEMFFAYVQHTFLSFEMPAGEVSPWREGAPPASLVDTDIFFSVISPPLLFDSTNHASGNSFVSN
mmetsp:Transcript_1416/g.2409  ORF Transcript_1416/g.2409 Transcript_1416/m.2409 type:complete len:81 (-) Transcript_1416:160-402(-)